MNEQVELTPQAGSDDGVLALMKRFNLPMTPESNTLSLPFLGDAPELGAEEEAGLPRAVPIKVM